MPQVIAVICADTHLQDRAWNDRPIEHDSSYALRDAVALAIKHGVDLIIAGDLLDRQRNTSAPVLHFSQALAALDRSGLRLLAIQGQHEMQELPWLSLRDNAVHLHGVMTAIGGRNFYGIDYQPAGLLQEELKKVPEGTDVLICHQVWHELMGPIGNPQGSLAEVPVVPLTVTGDYHVDRQFDVQCADGRTMTVLSPGSTCRQSVEEPAQKYAWLLHDDLTLMRVALRSRRHIEVTHISTLADLDLAVEQIPLQLSQAELAADDLQLRSTPLFRSTLRVTFDVGVENVRSRITALVGDRAHLFFKEVRMSAAEERSVAPIDDGALVPMELGHEAVTLTDELDAYLQAVDMRWAHDECLQLVAAAANGEEAVVDCLGAMRASFVASEPAAPPVAEEAPFA